MTAALSVVTENQDGTLRRPLHTLGVVGDLGYSTAWGGGCLTASWSLAATAALNHYALTPGRLVHIYDGTLEVWRGVLGDAERGSPWRMHAFGLSALCADYVSTSTAPGTAVSDAITRGLPLAGVGTITGTGVANAGLLVDVLNVAANQTGKRWGVWADGFLVQQTDPTTISYIVTASDTPGARSVAEDYLTHLYARYISSTTGLPTVVAASGNPASNGRLGRVEKIIDFTDLGSMAAASAQALMAGSLTLAGTRASFTGSVTVQPGALVSAGGVPVRLSTVRAGTLVRFVGCIPDPQFGELNYNTSVEVMIGQTDYDSASGLLKLTPIGHTPVDLAGTLAKFNQTWFTLSPVGAS